MGEASHEFKESRPPQSGRRTFGYALANTAVASLTVNFLWFAVMFWVYLETQSILVTGILSGAYMLLFAMCSMWFGSIVDRFRKISVMRVSAWCSLAAFSIATAMYYAVPEEALLDLKGPWLWLFALIVLAGSAMIIIRSLALSKLVTLLIPVERHANANGLIGTVQGFTMVVTSMLSGISIGQLGMGATLLIASGLTIPTLVHLYFLRIDEPVIVRDPHRRVIDFRGGMIATLAVPGLLGLVLFSAFFSLSSGLYSALLDPYGLTLFPVEAWGVLHGLTGTGFILGGALIAKFGLGGNPVRTMLLAVALFGIVGAVLALREWAWLFIGGIWILMLLMPAVEAAQQTVVQRLVPFEQQGRVFGLALTFQAAAAPIIAFLIAPMAEFWIVPYIDSPEGKDGWGGLLGEGDARGVAFIYFWAGILIAVTALAALGTRPYRRLVTSFAGADEAR